MRSRGGWVLAVVLVSACSAEHVSEDAGVLPDDAWSAVDGGLDSAVIDAAVIDGAVVDSAVTDSAVIDASTPDMAIDAFHCATTADCGDALVDDGFGGTVSVPQTCMASTCVPLPFETCDTTDDDDDGTIDEGCACVPAMIASRSASGLTGEAWFGASRILVSAWSDLGNFYDLVDTSGAVVRSSMGTGYHSFWPVVGGFDALRNVTLVHLHDDGTVASEPLVGSTTDVAQAGPWGAGVVRVSAGTRAGPWTVRRFAGAPLALAGETTLTTSGNATFWFGELTGGDFFWFEIDESGALRGGAIDAAMTVRETAPSTTAWRATTSELAVTSDRFWLTALDASGAPTLVSIDRATGAWSETLALGAIHPRVPFAGGPTTIGVTAQSDLLTVSWIDDALALRARVLDETGAEHGRTHLALSGTPTAHSSGPTAVGVRIVAAVGLTWVLVDPCAAP